MESDTNEASVHGGLKPTCEIPGKARQLTADDLTGLRLAFPGFRIWREMTGDRVRYVARSMRLDAGLHTVVTADPAELRALLGDAPARRQVADGEPGTGAPNIARMYSYWTGGNDHRETDRLAAGAILADFPQVADVARANREFVLRAVTYVAARGITQYLDIGTGLPATPAIHQIARRAEPGSRVAYIDNDPVVVARARALLAGPRVAVVSGDIRQPDALLSSPELRDLINLDQPVCVILGCVLHFVTAAQADAIIAALTAAMTPGSYLILSAGTSTGTDPALIDRLTAAYQDATVITARPEAEIAAYLTGVRLEPPGLADVWAWQPASRQRWLPSGARILGAVARKPVQDAPGSTAADRAQ